jgi:hypothetical protein
LVSSERRRPDDFGGGGLALGEGVLAGTGVLAGLGEDTENTEISVVPVFVRVRETGSRVAEYLRAKRAQRNS